MKQKDIYDEFDEAVGSKMGDNFIVELHDVVKENDNVQHGLVIRDNAKSVAPVLYLDPTYLQEVLRNGNRSVVAPGEVLSNNVLIYNTKMKDLTEIRVQERAGEERGER